MSYVIPTTATALEASRPRTTWPSRLMMLFFATTLVVPASIANKLIFAPLALMCFIELLLVDRSGIRKTKAPFIVFGIFTYGFALAWFDDFDRRLAMQFYI